MRAAAIGAVLALCAALTACQEKVTTWEEVLQVARPWGPGSVNAPNGCDGDNRKWSVKTQPWRQEVGKIPAKDKTIRTYCVTEAKAKATKVGGIWNG